MKVLAIAMLCHAANRAYCEALADHSQVAWADAPDWQKNSAIDGVNFVLQHPDAPPSASHDNWLAMKKADGWEYGPVKNAEKKEHPCFVPYEQLHTAQRAKDYIFRAIVLACNEIEPPNPGGLK